MIVQEFLEGDLVRTYSDKGVLIHGGVPESNYTEAIDPVNLGRVYTETDIPADEIDEGSLDVEYAEVGRIFMGVSE